MSKKPSQDLVGRRVRLIVSNDPTSKVLKGTYGRVTGVNESSGVEVSWEDNSKTELVFDAGDRWIVLPE